MSEKFKKKLISVYDSDAGQFGRSISEEELKNEYADLKGEHGEKLADRYLGDQILAKYLG